MSAYLETLSSASETRYYPVSEASNLTSATAAFRADGNPAPRLVASLPAPDTGNEWYVFSETVVTPTNPTNPTTPPSSSAGAITGTGTAIYQGRPVQYIIVQS